MAEHWLAWLRASCSYGLDTKKEIVLVPILAHIPDPFSPSVLGPHCHWSLGMCRKGKPSFPLPLSTLTQDMQMRDNATSSMHTHRGPEGGFSPPSPFLLHPPRPRTDGGLCGRVFPLPPSYAPHPHSCTRECARYILPFFLPPASTHTLCSAHAWLSKGAGYH
jgi:hypothetical protein